MGDAAFLCSRCGQCCRHISLFGPMYAWLVDEGGRCRYFDGEANRCLIYALRPLLCRVEEGYHLFFSHLSREEYLRMTREACAQLAKLP